MIQLFDVEIEFIKVFALGFFMGWIVRKYLYGSQERFVPWTSIKNVRFPFMNIRHKL